MDSLIFQYWGINYKIIEVFACDYSLEGEFRGIGGNSGISNKSNTWLKNNVFQIIPIN